MLVTLENDASTVYQVIQALRSGQLGSTAFKKVVLVGHSYGSLIAFLTAGRYQDVDALVATGASHQINVANVTTGILARSWPRPGRRRWTLNSPPAVWISATSPPGRTPARYSTTRSTPIQR